MQALSIVEQALVITVIGVVLIFAVLFVLWGLMAALVRASADPVAEQPAPAELAAETVAPSETDPRRRAAVVAAAVALALDAARRAPVPSPQSPQASLSSWQSTIRGSIMSQRAGAFRRYQSPRK